MDPSFHTIKSEADGRQPKRQLLRAIHKQASLIGAALSFGARALDRFGSESAAPVHRAPA
jgi:hypothetical protein